MKTNTRPQRRKAAVSSKSVASPEALSFASIWREAAESIDSRKTGTCGFSMLWPGGRKRPPEPRCFDAQKAFFDLVGQQEIDLEYTFDDRYTVRVLMLLLAAAIAEAGDL